MKHTEIRKKFKDFFNQQKHTWIRSSSLIPFNDPSLLFVNAGMNPFKNILLGIESTEHKSVAAIQKCVRAGGKHNDLEQVGPSHYHHTFFEMMGNFSFGDYFKEEACYLAWTFLTKNLNIPKENLAVSVFKKDKETAEIWNKKINIPKERIFLFGEEDNFWRMGESGPCGPCSEIYFDFEAFRSGTQSMIEVWNLVFMEYNESLDKKKTPLQTKCIDTGMGLERLAMILQNKRSNYHTDLFLSILETISQVTNTPYRQDTTNQKELALNAILRAIADHIRAGVFLISDGVYPSSEKRGYVLRRILRRALYQASTLTDQKSIFKNIAETVIGNYHSSYPELDSQRKIILESFQTEEEKFFHTLTQGKSILEKELYDLQKKNKKVLPGEISFKLYDTYGFPFDLVQLICKQRNIKVDVDEFTRKLNKARLENVRRSLEKQRGHSATLKDEEGFLNKLPDTNFIGYDRLESTSKILALFDESSSSVSELKAPCKASAVFDQTCFYAEGGGQIGDQGKLLIKEPQIIAKIENCQNFKNKYYHTFFLETGELKVGQTCLLKVCPEHRKQTAIHHSATHLLHSALRQVLGSQTKQAGSLVEPNRLRFDFTHNKALTEEELAQVEDLVNKQITQAENVEVSYKNYDKALKDGALSFFERPSLDKVRVLKMGDFSHELCGGTHVQNTKDILFFKIVSESSLGSGVRRIKAICGQTILNFINEVIKENIIKVRKIHASVESSLTVSESSFSSDVRRIEDIYGENLSEIIRVCIKARKIKNQSKKSKKTSSIDISSLNLSETFTLNSKKGVFYCAVHSQADHELLSTVSDQIKKKYPLAVVITVSENNSGNIPIVVALPKEISGKIKAQDVIKNLGGKGGGPPHFAKGALNKSLSEKTLRQKVLDLFHKEGLLKNLK